MFNIYYKQLSINNISQILELHKEWYPIEFSIDYFILKFKEQDNNKALLYGCFINFNIELINHINNCIDNADTNKLNYKKYILLKNIMNNKFLIGLIIVTLKSHYKRPLLIDEIYTNNTYYKIKNSLLSYFFNHYNYGYINSLGVIDEMRGIGVSKQLIQLSINWLNRVNNLYKPDKSPKDTILSLDYKQIINYLNNWKIPCIYLHVIEYNLIACNVYDKLGFSNVGKIHNFYKINNVFYNAIVYAKIIDYSYYY